MINKIKYISGKIEGPIFNLLLCIKKKCIVSRRKRLSLERERSIQLKTTGEGDVDILNKFIIN